MVRIAARSAGVSPVRPHAQHRWDPGTMVVKARYPAARRAADRDLGRKAMSDPVWVTSPCLPPMLVGPGPEPAVEIPATASAPPTRAMA
jgi:hypothetical protein